MVPVAEFVGSEVQKRSLKQLNNNQNYNLPSKAAINHKGIGENEFLSVKIN